MIKKISIPVITVVFILFCIVPVSSCTRQPDFGDLIICSEIDPVTFFPLDTMNNFDIEVQKIFAAIEVSGIKAEDIWKFIWVNEDSEEVIAQPTDRYSNENSGYISGYLSNYVTPGEEGGIIGEPGNYRVEFYHNDRLISSADFTIEYPEMELIDVALSNEIDEAGQPAAVRESFYPDDIIYTCLKLNCQIKGETAGVRWYLGEDELLGEKEITIDTDYYLPRYIIFEITNDKLWPIGGYRIEVFGSSLLEREYRYEITEEEIPDATFNSGNIYENESYGFSILGPDGWGLEDNESNKGLEINFIPDSENINVVINMRVLKENYAPSEDQYSDFAEELLKEVVEPGEASEIEKAESSGEINEIIYRQINYRYPGEDNDGWDGSIIFINQDDMLYLLIKFSDIYYGTFADNVLRSMLESLSFK
ncbi:MAG: hypothetical protein WC549_07450 [Actinomycetota bacterium]